MTTELEQRKLWAQVLVQSQGLHTDIQLALREWRMTPEQFTEVLARISDLRLFIIEATPPKDQPERTS